MTDDRIKANVQLGIMRSASEIFEAVVNPDIMTRYFISGSNGIMESGKTLTWTWTDYEGKQEVKVGKIEKDKVVSFEWSGSGVNCVVVITLEPRGNDKTLVMITESEWPADYKGANQCMGQVQGWTHFLMCMKAYLEYGIDLRIGGVLK
jgi:uncharacterized protein YndB with AHSA1/START domain